MSSYESVIGLEVHAQLSTDSKIFALSAAHSGAEANTLCDPVTLGLPGALPVLNRRVVDYAIKIGLALECEINRESVFERKHYFYPDLPKGYQISQYEHPICSNGRLAVRMGEELRTIGITRIHLEEDAGKSTHSETEPVSYADLNRAGVPLVEIVSEPDLRTPAEAAAYMRQLRQIVRYLDICDGNMEDGSLRCDANISLRPYGQEEFGTKVEIKNLNSFRFVERAIEHEIQRQTLMLEQGEKVIQETRLWDEQKSATKPMRSKEYAEDYRYFPDPDLPTVVVDPVWIDKARSSLPELPEQVFSRFKTMYALDDYYAERLSEEKLIARFYDQAVSEHNNPTALANWITTELYGRMNREGVNIEECPVSPQNLAMLVRLIDEGVISGKIAKSVFDEMFSTSASPDSIIEAKGLRQVSDPEVLNNVIRGVLEQNPQQVAQFREGKEKMLGFFVGQVMRETQGKANPEMVNEILRKLLSEDA